jgi:hypothetical protein
MISVNIEHVLLGICTLENWTMPYLDSDCTDQTQPYLSDTATPPLLANIEKNTYLPHSPLPISFFSGWF